MKQTMFNRFHIHTLMPVSISNISVGYSDPLQTAMQLHAISLSRAYNKQLHK